MSGRLISPKILGLNAGNLGLFCAVPETDFRTVISPYVFFVC